MGPSGRIFLAKEGDDSYLSQVVDSSAKPAKPTLFPTAAAVFGTSNQSVFGTPISDIPVVFQFGSGKPVKLQFGGGKPGEKFEFKAATSPFKFGSKAQKPGEEGGKKEKQGKQESSAEKPSFSIGIGGAPRGPVAAGRRARRRSKNSPPAEDSKNAEEEEEEEEVDEEKEGESRKQLKQEEKEKSDDGGVSQPPKIMGSIKQALSPAMAECQRAVYAAFLWQEGLVHDAIASATYLKFHPELSKEHSQDLMEKKKERDKEKEVESDAAKEEEKKEKEGEEPGQSKQEASEEAKEGEKQADVKEKPGATTPAEPTKSGPVLPPTLNHLVTFWDEISAKVIESSSQAFSAPKVPTLAQELQKRYEEERKEIEKRRKEKDKKAAAPAGGGGGGGGGSTVCELCDGTFADPVTYHMKDVHPGCGKHASGWGYNSRGTFCSGWAGNCGDGGRGGSTWYLMCKDCHAKYLAMKDEMKKKTVKTVPLPKMKTRKPGKPRTLKVMSAVEGMIQNAKFLLEISRSCDSTPTTPAGKPPAVAELLTGSSEYSRQASSPADERSSGLFYSNMPPPPPLGKVHSDLSSLSSTTQQRPAYLRSYSVATGTASKEVSKRPQSESDETPSPVMRQSTVDDATTPSLGDSQDSSLMVGKYFQFHLIR